MPLEEKELSHAANKLESKIKQKMLEKGYSQIELANLLKENRSTISAAIGGYPNKKSKEVRKRIFKILGMEGE